MAKNVNLASAFENNNFFVTGDEGTGNSGSSGSSGTGNSGSSGSSGTGNSGSSANDGSWNWSSFWSAFPGLVDSLGNVINPVTGQYYYPENNEVDSTKYILLGLGGFMLLFVMLIIFVKLSK